MKYLIKILCKFYLISSVWFTSMIVIYTLVNWNISLESFSLLIVLLFSLGLGLMQMCIEHFYIKRSDKELNQQVKQFQKMKQKERKAMKKINKKITTPGIDSLKLQPGLINILFVFAIMNPKVQTIVEQHNMGLDVSDEDGHVFLKQYRMSLPAKVIITKEECKEENLYTMALYEEVQIPKRQMDLN